MVVVADREPFWTAADQVGIGLTLVCCAVGGLVQGWPFGGSVIGVGLGVAAGGVHRWLGGRQ